MGTAVRDEYEPDGLMSGTLKALMLALIVLAVVLFWVGLTYARDLGQYAQQSPDLKRWVEGLTDADQKSCCAFADGYKPEDIEWDTAGNGYRVKIVGEWLSVPDAALIKEPNRLGYAVVWYFIQNGKPVIRCFLPGDLH